MNAQNLLQQAAQKARQRIRRDIEDVDDDLGAVLALVEKNLFEPAFNVREAGASPVQLRRLRLALSQTLQQYIEDRRLETACELLAGTKLKVVDIAETVGYSSLSAFSRAFTRWSGERPTTYRRTHRRQQVSRGLLDNAIVAPENARDDPSEKIWRELQRCPQEEQGERLLGFYPTDSDLVRLFCRKSREVRNDDSAASIHRAYLATVAAKLMVTESMAPQEEREHLLMRIESWIELGNAYRQAGLTTRALRAVTRADSLAYGRAVPLAIRVRLVTLEADLRRDEEKYQESIALIDKAIALVPKDKGLVGELLTKKGAVQSASGDIRGLSVIEEGLMLIREAKEKTSTPDTVSTKDEKPAGGRREEAP